MGYPYLPFFVDDWLSSPSVSDFTLEQQGAYLRLLCWAWKTPKLELPRNEHVLAEYSGLGARWAKVGRPIIKRCFETSPQNGYVNPRLQQEWHRVQGRSSIGKKAAETRWKAKKANGKP